MKTLIYICSPRKNSLAHLFRSAHVAGLTALLFGLLSMAGCSSNSSTSTKPQVGAITFTDVNGVALKTPPTSLTIGQGTYVAVNLTDDRQLLGADWSVSCGSAPLPGTPLPPGQTQDQSCGTFTPAHTMSGPIPSYITKGTGYVALYTSPSAPPKQGVVTIYASATADHSRFAAVTLTIGGQPISLGFAPAPPSSMQVGASAQFKAALNNDATNAGVQWSVVCGSSDCGFFGPVQTISGVTTTYVAPATIPIGGTVQVTATSIADPTKAVSATITITTAGTGLVTGAVQAAQQPVSGAEVTLYAAATSDPQNEYANSSNLSSVVSAFTDRAGNFSIPYGYECPSMDAQMYLVATGGNARGGTNPNLALMAALGSCSSLDSTRFIVNEATTVAAVYALNGFMTDIRHVGSKRASPIGMSIAFATAKDLVDPATGIARFQTVSGRGLTPQTKINALANLLNACAKTAGSSAGDGSNCDQLFQKTNPGKTPENQATNTLQALINLVHNETGFPDKPNSFAALFQLSQSDTSFEPAITIEPNDWTLAIQFPNGSEPSSTASAKTLQKDIPESYVDAAGNVWVPGDGAALVEIVGGVPGTSASIKTSTASVP